MAGNPIDSPWRSTPSAKRKNKPLNLTLTDEIRAKLARLAGPGGSVSRVVSDLVEAAPDKSTGA